jgi:predicted nucleic acid-binding protein
VGLVIDTGVLVLADRRKGSLDLARYSEYGVAFISAITAAELLVAVHRAADPAIRASRTAFVESILAALPALPVDLETARVRAQLVAQMPESETVGAHDALIAATALRHGHAVLTNNGCDFRKLPGVAVVDYTAAPPPAARSR